MTKLLLVGCGKMGGALLSGWRAANSALQVEVIDLQQTEAHASLADVPAAFIPDIILFAVKPQSMDVILPEYAKRFGAQPLYVSIAAGKSTAYFTKYLGGGARIVRAMPNTPALVAKGMTVLFADKIISHAERESVSALFTVIGKTAWVNDEEQMHAVTGLSGSGPAYVFLFLDALVESGVKLGLPEALARELALQTFSGSSALASASPESFSTLRNNVTSPGGTTEAALAVLMKEDVFERLINDALVAAVARSKTL